MELCKYRLYCVTEAEQVYTDYRDSVPTVCPHNEAHTINEASITIVDQTQYIQAGIVNPDNEVVNWPMTSGDGVESRKMPLMNPNILPAGYLFYATGAFDDIAGGKRGEGTALQVTKTDAGVAMVEGRFFEHCYIHGGDFGVLGEDLGDWLSMMAYAAASAPEDRTATHDGNANKVATGLGFNIVVPAPLGDGDWNVDGSTKEAGEINLNLVPVPNANESGYWDWDPDANPSITPVSNPASPDGAYDLYDAAFPLVRQANRISCLLHEKSCCPESLKGKKILPHWTIRFTVNRASAGTLKVAFTLKLSRKSTVNGGDLL